MLHQKRFSATTYYLCVNNARYLSRGISGGKQPELFPAYQVVLDYTAIPPQAREHLRGSQPVVGDDTGRDIRIALAEHACEMRYKSWC